VGKGSVLVSSIGDALALFLCYLWSGYADAPIGAIVTLLWGLAGIRAKWDTMQSFVKMLA